MKDFVYSEKKQLVILLRGNYRFMST